MNKAIIMGRLGKDPEVKNFEGGGMIANVTVATDESYKDREGNKVSQTEWHNVVFRGKTAEVVEKYLNKGDQCLIEGRIRTRSWEDKDGNKRFITEILADRFHFVGSKGQGQAAEHAKPAAAQALATPQDTGEDDLPF